MGANCPKQYLSLAGKCILEHTLGVCSPIPPSPDVIVALAPHRWFETLTVATDPRVLRVEGGSEARLLRAQCVARCRRGHWCMTPPGPV